MTIVTVGLDIAKQIFQAHGAQEAKQLRDENTRLRKLAGCSPCRSRPTSVV